MVDRDRTQCVGGTFALADGASTSRTTDGANPLLREGDILRQVCVELPTASPSISVVIHIVQAGKVIELKAGWVRGASDHGGAGALIWTGEQSLSKKPSLFIFARNETGVALVPTLHFVMERT